MEVHKKMKRPDRIAVTFGAIVLASVTLVGAFSASATGGDQTDPLITLSYLTQVVTPELMTKVDEQVAVNEQALVGKVDAAIAEYSAQMEQALGGPGGGSAAYTLVTVARDALLCPGAGSEVLLRTGTAKAMSGTAPVLLDSTSGNTVSIGGTLQTNHLYIIPLEGTVISASTECTFLVRGSYTVV